ncbi:MAG TPA: hypothetical protein VGK58_12360 [Lacipirellulaceae bacterium]
MSQADVDIAGLTPPVSRPAADPAKIQRMGQFDWSKYSPIIIEKVGDQLIIQDGMTRVEAARRAGVTSLPAYVFEDK